MRIAIVTTSYPRHDEDPSGHFVQSEARELVAAGHDVVVFAPDARESHDRIDVISRSSQGALGWPGAASRLAERPNRLVGAGRWMHFTRAALRHSGPYDRIVAHWSVPSAWPIAHGRHGELEVVSHGGDVRMLARVPRSARELIVATIADRASSWRFVSESLRDRLLTELSAPLAARVLAIAEVRASALKIPDVRDRARAIRAENATPLVCSVGRLVPKKRVDRVVTFAAREHAGKRLVVIGDGPERARLVRMAAREHVDARFLGTLPRNEALAWIAASEALLFASEAEGCSTVVREAEALGVRVERVA